MAIHKTLPGMTSDLSVTVAEVVRHTGLSRDTVQKVFKGIAVKKTTLIKIIAAINELSVGDLDKFDTADIFD